jgi:secreted trypsin-like serine protease
MASRLTIALIVTTSVATGQLITRQAHAITYGDPVIDAVGNFPEVISVWSDGEDGYLYQNCTATLISQQIAITAAHCVQGASTDLSVEVGANILKQGRQISVIASWYNPRYSSQRIANDVGVLYLAEPANVGRVARLDKKISVGSKTKLLMAGWGNDQNGDQVTQLRKLSVKADAKAGRRWFGKSFNATTTVAAGRYFKTEQVYGGACNGDSGGPLFSGSTKGVRNLVGIVSYGTKGCDEDAPTVFARVKYYWKTIQDGISAVTSEAANKVATINATPLSGSITVTKPYSMLPYWDIKVFGSTSSLLSLKRWCFYLDSRPLARSEISYGSGDMPYSAEADGCFSSGFLDESLTSGNVQLTLSGLPNGAHTLYGVLYDSYGRTVTTPTATFVK